MGTVMTLVSILAIVILGIILYMTIRGA